MDHAKYFKDQAAFWWNTTGARKHVQHCLAAASALDRLAALERELAEARKENEANLAQMDKAILEAQRGEKKAIATVEQLRVELAEARKPCPCKVREAVVDAAMEDK